MTYSFQSFSVNQILASSEMNQVEVNIRDHVHGDDGVAGLTPNFTSSDQTVTLNTLLTVAHGLALPSLIMVTLKCTTTDLGYAVDDEIPWATNGALTGSGDSGATVFFDDTNVFIRQGNDITLHNASFNSASITVGSWRWVVRAWS